MHSMNKKKKQWMKYAAVVLTFLVMAGLFMPGTKTQVNATEAQGSVSDGNLGGDGTLPPVEDITPEDGWSVTVNFSAGDGVEWDEEATKQTPILSGGVYEIIFPEQPQPKKEKCFFEGWKCESLSDDLYKSGNLKIASEKITHDTEFTFIAQWTWDNTFPIESGGVYPLKAETQYTLGTGTWTVSGDDYNYTGGSTFYVGTDGDYTFTKN